MIIKKLIATQPERCNGILRINLRRFWVASILLAGALHAPVFAAGATVVNEDRNYRIAMIDSLADGKSTRLFYVTYPEVTQAHVREECTANYYVLDIQPGLANPQPKLLAENYCGHALGKSGALLANGDAAIVFADRFEIWRLGVGKVSGWSLSGVQSLQSSTRSFTAGGTNVGIAPDGNLVVATMMPRKRKDTTTPSGMVVGLSADGAIRWSLELAEAGVLMTPMDVWATYDGGALLHVMARPMASAGIPGAKAAEGMVTANQSRLYRISAGGELSTPVIAASMQMIDVSKPRPPPPNPVTDPEGYEATMRAMGELLRATKNTRTAAPYTAGQVIAQPRDDGSIDVLMGRESKQARFMRIGADGSMLLEATLDQVIADEGLNRWQDGYATADQVVLFGVLSSRQFRSNQGYVSWINIPPGDVITRIAPLGTLGRDEVSKASDEQIQFLEHNPSHRPQMLTRLDGKPLMVSLVLRSRRPAIQLDEGTDQLVPYTDAREDR